MESNEIEVIAFFYERGKTKADYLRKEIHHIVVPTSQNLTLCQLKKVFTEQSGIKETAKQLGWSDWEISLSRGKKGPSGINTFAIRSDFQVRLEMPRIIGGGDKLHATIYPVEARFKSGVPIITVEVTTGNSGTSEIERSKIIPKSEEIEDHASLATELEELSKTKLVNSSTGRAVKLKHQRTLIWPWDIICGLCDKKCMLRVDGTTNGRVAYFRKKHYDDCFAKKNKIANDQGNIKRQSSIKEAFSQPSKKRRKQKELIDSDIEISDDDEEKPDSDIELSDSDDYQRSDNDQPSSDQEILITESDSGTVYDSETELIDINSFDENWRFFCIADIEADPVCRRLDRLIRDGSISKDQILYKHLDNMTQIFFDSKHPYDKDVVEFFSSIVHLGGESTYNLVRGPMRFGNKERDDRFNELRMNFGGPGIETIRKSKAAYTTAPGVLKYLSILLYSLLKNDNDSPKPILSNATIDVFPVVFSNDGTALKPSIQFDEDRNVNVGLQMHEINYDQCKSKQFLEKEVLFKNIVCEAVVSSVTSLNNDVCLPVAVHYCSKSGKSGDNIKETFTEQIRLIQMCENCSTRSESIDMVFPKDKYLVCKSYCASCYQKGTVCEACSLKGQTEIHPALRACDYCLNNNIHCTRRCVFVITVDCESGNKQCLKQFQQEIEDKSIDPYLSLLSILPDVPHVLKTCKASFSNWYLQLNNERGCLSIFYTLRNRADPDVRKVVKSHLKSNDYVRNRDRQSPIGVLAICNADLLIYIKTLGFVTHTIVPETIRFTKLNRKDMYSNIASIAIGSHGSLLFLCDDEPAAIFTAKLHNPVQDIKKLVSNANGKKIRYNNGLVYCFGNSFVSIYPVDKKSNPKVSVDSIKSKKVAIAKLHLLGLPANGTISECKERLKKHQKSVVKKYQHLKIKESTLVFYIDQKICQYSVDAIVFIDSDTIYVAFGSEKTLAIGSLKQNSVGVEATCTLLKKYNDDWQAVSDISVVNQYLVIAHNKGLSLFHLESHVISKVPHCDGYTADCLASFKDGFLFATNNCIHFWRSNGIEVFAGRSGEEGSRDGTASYCRFYDASSIAVEFNNVVYVSDRKVGSIKIVTELKETANFLIGLKHVIDAFSVHEKHKSFSLKSLDEAISLVSQCDAILSRNTDAIRSVANLTRSLNGPEGNVSAVTINSVKMLLWGLKRLKQTTESLQYNNVNLLSCMTLAVENLHSAINKKQGTQTLVSYAQSFATSIKESIKSITKWSAHYFTSRERWYPLPDSVLSLKDLNFPKRRKKQHRLSAEQKREMREWASVNGAVVRQRSGRQETTMARAGTLPENAYFEELRPSNNANNQDKATDEEDCVEQEEQEEIPEFESDSDGNESSEDEEAISSVSRQATFLVGTATRYGRSITFNRRYLQ